MKRKQNLPEMNEISKKKLLMFKRMQKSQKCFFAEESLYFQITGHVEKNVKTPRNKQNYLLSSPKNSHARILF